MGTLTYQLRLRRRLRDLNQAYRPTRPSRIEYAIMLAGCAVAAFVVWGVVALLLSVAR